eukprot:833996-Prymnesium_polylepis.1
MASLVGGAHIIAGDPARHATPGGCTAARTATVLTTTRSNIILSSGTRSSSRSQATWLMTKGWRAQVAVKRQRPVPNCCNRVCCATQEAVVVCSAVLAMREKPGCGLPQP